MLIVKGDHGVFVLGGDQEVLDGAATFEMGLDTIPTTDLFDTFTKTLCVGYDYVMPKWQSDAIYWYQCWDLACDDKYIGEPPGPLVKDTKGT